MIENGISIGSVDSIKSSGVKGDDSVKSDGVKGSGVIGSNVKSDSIRGNSARCGNDIKTDTRSVCPICLRQLEASYERDDDGNVMLVRNCPEHGETREVIWRNCIEAEEWGDVDASKNEGTSRTDSPIDGSILEDERPENAAITCDFNPNCPSECIGCRSHITRPCCVLLEVTSRCNLVCPVCFAQSESGCVESDTPHAPAAEASCGDGSAPGDTHSSTPTESASGDPSLSDISAILARILEQAGTANLQISGGEPTVRDDLPQILELARSMGFEYLQINTNGLRIANDPGYARLLKDSGASCVFLQFDGVTDDVYRKLRGRPLMAAKRKAIENCVEAKLPVVLVPTVAAGINDDQLGDIVEFAIRRSPTVRGVHIQPLARFGRVPILPEGRMTIPDVLLELEYQTDGMVQASDFKGGSTESPYCSFSASYRIANDKLENIASAKPSCCGSPIQHNVERARLANKLRWGTQLDGLDDEVEEGSLDAFLNENRRTAFSITGMSFMDCYTMDLERLRRCYIFIANPKGNLIPFCAYNLTDSSGRGLYRKRAGEASGLGAAL